MNERAAVTWAETHVEVWPHNGLLSGERVAAGEYNLIVHVAGRKLVRFGMRTTGQVASDSLVATAYGAQGQSSSVPFDSVALDEEGEGISLVVAELRTPGWAERLEVRIVGEDAWLFGPIAVEQYSQSAEGVYLGPATSVPLDESTRAYRLRSSVLGGSPQHPVQINVRFFDTDGNELLPPADSSISPLVGGYAVLRDQAHDSRWEAPLRVPVGTAAIAMSRLKGSSQSGVLLGSEIVPEAVGVASIDEFLAGLPEDMPLVVIDSTAPPMGSGHITIRPHNLSREYAALGYAVVSIGLGNVRLEPRVVHETVFQASRDEYWETMQAVLPAVQSRRCLYVCSSHPSASAVLAMEMFAGAGWTTLYEVRDDMEEFNRVGYSKWYSPLIETRICRDAEHLSTVSPVLSAKIRGLAEPGAHVETIPNAIQLHYIVKGLPLRSLEVLEAKRKRGIVGYVGHLTDAWFDWATVLACAESLPDVSFEIIGPGFSNDRELPANISYLGPKPQDELQSHTEGWAVGLIPFRKSPLTRGVDPNKLFEYCAWGLRTVSAEMGSIDDCPTAVSYRTTAEMIAAVRRALDEPWSQVEADAAEHFIRSSTWSDRAQRTLKMVGML